MKKSILVLSVIAGVLMFSSCENENLNDKDVDNENVLSKDVEFDYITVGRNIAQNIDLENFELHQESINSAFSDVDIEGKEIITVQLIEDILAEGDRSEERRVGKEW